MQRSVKLICSHVHVGFPKVKPKCGVGLRTSSTNLSAIVSAARMMISGNTESMCVGCLGAEGRVWRFDAGWSWRFNGKESRQLRENLESKESRMQTARAMVSIGRPACANICCTAGMDGVMNEAPGGSILARWAAGPV